MARKPRTLDGLRTCSRCLQSFEENAENFYYAKEWNQYSGKCKPCHREAAKESAEKNKYDKKRRALIQEAKSKGDKMKKCQKCNMSNPAGSFVPYDTNVYINDTLVIKGYKEICGVCYYRLHNKVFSRIAGCIAYANERAGKKPRKKRKLEIYNTNKV
jgi:hypothetical protein